MHLQEHDDCLLTLVTEPGVESCVQMNCFDIDVFADGGAFTLGLVNLYETEVLETKLAITQMKTRIFRP